MSAIPAHLKFTQDHEWVLDHGDGTVSVGVTEHAQQLLGELVFVETPEVGRTVGQGEACAVVESVKSAADVYAPLAGEVVAVNETLADQPEQVNEDTYGAGWLFKLRPSDVQQLAALMDPAAYEALLANEA